MRRFRIFTLGFVALLAAACAAPGGTGGPTASTPAGSAGAVVTVEPTDDACAAANLDTTSAGQLTIGTDEPAFPPFYSIEDPMPSDSIWTLGYPPNGEGLEAATAYAVAQKLGFTADQVVWVVSPFDLAIQPGDKNFDMHLGQISYSPERAEVVDLSDGYFDLNQAVVGLAGTPIMNVTTVAGLKPFRLGAALGTTSYQYIVDQIKPDPEPRVYNDNTGAIAGLEGDQIDGIVADLPTTFYMRDAQLTGGQIVGALPTAPGATVEHFSILLNKDNPLTSCVNGAVAAIQADGALAAIVDQWITTQGGAPELK